MTTRIAIIAALVVAFLLGGWIGDEVRPKPQRPVLKFLGKAARLGLWLLVAESNEPSEPQYAKTHFDPDHIDHMRSL